MRPLAVRRTTSGAVIVAGALAFAALFLGEGTTLGRLVWIGGAALLLAAIVSSLVLLGVIAVPRLDRAGSLFLVALFGLAVWSGLTTIWSISPEDSWQYTNRTLAYAAFALVGAVVAAQLRSPGEWFARGAALLLAALYGWALLSKCIPSLYTDYGRL
ncbi:MAG: hypothetical protein JOY72_09515, partial [Actinobacteria bacterium]|nr:hypothetical protein [Actinomycetota bacterium]